MNCMDYTGLRTKWDTAIARLTALVPSSHPSPKDPVYALEYLTLIHVRKFIASGGPQILVLHSPPGVDTRTIRALVDKQGLKRIPLLTDRAMRASEIGGEDYHCVSPEEFAGLSKNDSLVSIE